jgi:predicted ATP-dependent endonuclease of OLD family
LRSAKECIKRGIELKIQKIEIKNYRSLHNLIICPKGILALVGRNNSGKSNLIKALELFFEGSTRLVNDECFYNHKTGEPIEILITFDQLSDWEREQFGHWMDEDNLVVGRQIFCTGADSYTINNLAITKVPEPEWLREDIISGDKITEWWSKKDELKINGLDFGVELGASKPGVGKWKEAVKKFLDEHRDEIPWKKERRENPKGYPGVLKGALPEFIHIPAVRDISEEVKVAKTNPFGQLINSVLVKISGEQKDAISKQLKEIEKRLNRSEEGERITQIKDVEDRLNKLMSELMECDIEIEMAMPQLREVFGEAKIYADDGVRTTIETKGHGMQRSMIFTILRAYAELAHVQKAEERAGERTTIFAIEEPELYLHPQSQRTLMSVFREIASGRDQVIYSTQSSIFVDISHFDHICIMRREKRDESYESYPTQLSILTMIEDLKARKGVDATEEGIREQYSHAFNPMINEGFFADKVVIVEGPSEQYALPIYADAFGYNLDRNNISVVHSDGKGQMDRLLRVFNGFKIPTYLWFDGDKNNKDKDVRDKTLELLELLGEPVEKIEDAKTKVSDRYAILEYKLEETLKDELVDYEKLVQQAVKSLGPTGKPLKHRFIANTLKRRIDNGETPEDVLPKTIIKIVEKVKELSYSGSILQKLRK